MNGLNEMGAIDADLLPKSDWLIALTYVPYFVVSWFFVAGFKFLVNMARGRDTGLRDGFQKTGLVLPAMVVWLIYYVPHFLLCVVCARSGLTELEYVAVVTSTAIAVLYLLWMPTVLVLVDRTSQPLEAITYAFSYVARNIFLLLGLFIVSLCVYVVSFLALGVGLFFGIPFILLMLAVAYTSNTPET